MDNATLEMVDHGYEIVNLLFLLPILVLAWRLHNKITLKFQQRAMKLFIVAIALFIAAEVITFSNYLMMQSERLEFVSETLETLFVLLFAASIGYYAISEKREIVTMRISSEIDKLTGLHNADYFRASGEKTVKKHKETGAALSLIIIDLDYFKHYNDKYGHEAGNAALQYLAQILINNVRTDDILARYGGEEFVIITKQSHYNAAQLANRIRQRVEAEMALGASPKVKQNVTLSAGVATVDDTVLSLSDLIEKADIALYQAKQTGRNKVCSAST